jgi:hypothetical protein
VPTKARKAWTLELQENHPVTFAMSCAIVGLSGCAYFYLSKLLNDSVIISVFNAITVRHLRWGFPNCFNRFRKLGYQWIH